MKLTDFINHPDVLVELDKDLQKYSTMRLKAKGDLLTVKTVEALSFLIGELYKRNIQYHILGWGANVLLPEVSPIPYIQLDFNFDRALLNEAQKSYSLPASVSLATLTSHANKFGLRGWEVFTGIPASLGGAIYMNAGTNLGEIGSIIKDVTVVDKTGQVKVIPITKDSFSYRKNHFVNPGDVIVWATLFHNGESPEISQKIKSYLEMRTKTQPLKEWTCGCVFKNHQDFERDLTCRAGLFIDIIGLKGLTIGNLRVSPKHANFMENAGESTKEDVLQMIDVLKKELKLHTGISFETEVEY